MQNIPREDDPAMEDEMIFPVVVSSEDGVELPTIQSMESM